MVASVIEVGGTPRGSVVRQLARQAVRQRPPEPAGMDRRRRTLQNTTGGLGPENPLFRVAHDRIVARCVVAASSHSSPLGAGRAGAGSRREPWIPRGASPRVRRTQLAQARDPGVERAETRGLSSPPVLCPCLRTCMHARTSSPRTVACIRTVSSAQLQGEACCGRGCLCWRGTAAWVETGVPVGRHARTRRGY